MKLEKRKVLKSLLRRKTVTLRESIRLSMPVEEKEDPIKNSQKILESIDR